MLHGGGPVRSGRVILPTTGFRSVTGPAFRTGLPFGERSTRENLRIDTFRANRAAVRRVRVSVRSLTIPAGPG